MTRRPFPEPVAPADRPTAAPGTPGRPVRPGPPGEGAACLAPFTSLYLDPRGWVRACVANREHVIGHASDGPLAELWRGEAARALRIALAAHDHSLGCRVCAWQSASDPGDALARIFDQLAPASPEPDWPSQLELALGNDCNLRCAMCNGELSSSIRARREHLPRHPTVYDEAFFAGLAEVLPHLERLRFLGGEPFLVPEHHRVWDLLIEGGLRVPCHVTTNGTRFDRQVERVLEGLPVSLAVSMDGIRPATVESIRIGTELRVLLRNVERFRDYVERAGTELTLTFTLMRQNAHELADFLRYADDLDVSVFVNSLYSPRRMSLYFLPAHELRAVVSAMEAADRAAVRPLGRNRTIWEDQIERLHRRTEVLAGGNRPAADRRWDNVSLGADQLDGRGRGALVDEARRWAGGRSVVEVELDDREQVVAYRSDDGSFLGAPVDPVGLGMDELSQLLDGLFGRRCAGPGPEDLDAADRVLRYDDRGEGTEVRILAEPAPRPDIAARAVFAARQPAG